MGLGKVTHNLAVEKVARSDLWGFIVQTSWSGEHSVPRHLSISWSRGAIAATNNQNKELGFDGESHKETRSIFGFDSTKLAEWNPARPEQDEEPPNERVKAVKSREPK